MSDVENKTREELVEYLYTCGYELDKLEQCSYKTLVKKALEEEALLENDEDEVESNFEDAELEDDDEEERVKPVQNVVVRDQPARDSDEWQKYVISQFTESERFTIQREGKNIETARADGFRRVGEKLLGTVAFAGPVEQASGYDKDGNPWAWVKYQITFVDHLGRSATYASLGEVNSINTEDDFVGFALTTAETKAKGRAWREALGIRLYAVEEFSGSKNVGELVKKNRTTGEVSDDAPITVHQIKTIKNMCKKLGICPTRFLNQVYNPQTKVSKYSGKNPKYEGYEDEQLTMATGHKMIKLLNDIQQGTCVADESLKDTDNG